MAVSELRTKVELREKIAGRLGLTNLGESIDTQEANAIDNAIDEGFRQLNRKDNINFDMSDDAAIEIYLFNSLSDYITPLLLEEYPQPQEREDRLRANGGLVAEAKIVSLINDKYTAKTNRSVSF